MKAITLTQPWATLSVVGLKPYETRSWSTSHTGILAIHAAARMDEDAEGLALELEQQQVVGPFIRAHLKELGWPTVFPRGSVVGVAILGHCVRADTVALDRRRFGNFGPRRWAWPLGDGHPISLVRVRGQLGVWDWPLHPSNPDFGRVHHQVFNGYTSAQIHGASGGAAPGVLPT